MTARECCIKGCARPYFGHDFCRAHYKKWRKYGHPLRGVVIRAVGRPLAERVWANIARGGPDDCWPWLAYRTQSGHGILGIGRRQFRAHRLVWELIFGPIPDGLCVRHRCDNPPCCNPAHLELGTHADNMRDMAERGRARGGSTTQTAVRGSQHGQAKLSETSVRAIRVAYEHGRVSQGTLAEKYGVRQATVSALLRRRTWTHI